MTDEHQRFDRLPSTAADADDADDSDAVATDAEEDGTPTREAVLDFFEESYGIPRATFDDYTFWERGRGKVWLFRGEAPSPVAIQGLGMTLLRTRQEHWKPTTDAVQRFGRHATENVVTLDRTQARRFVAGEDQDLPSWEGDWGYLIVAHELAADREPIGVGLYLHDELRSQVPKGRRRDLDG